MENQQFLSVEVDEKLSTKMLTINRERSERIFSISRKKNVHGKFSISFMVFACYGIFESFIFSHIPISNICWYFKMYLEEKKKKNVYLGQMSSLNLCIYSGFFSSYPVFFIFQEKCIIPLSLCEKA